MIDNNFEFQRRARPGTEIATAAEIHDSALIEPGTIAGDRLRVAAFSQVVNSRLGDEVVIMSYVSVVNSTLGNRVHVNNRSDIIDATIGDDSVIGRGAALIGAVLLGGNRTGSAHIEEAQIGRSSNVWNGAHVRNDAVIGDDCNIGGDVFVGEGVTIGDGSKVINGARLHEGITVGRGVFLGPGTTTTNDHWPRAFNQDWKLSKTIFEDGASVGAGAEIVCRKPGEEPLTIGSFALVGSGATVRKSVEPHRVIVGEGRHAGWVDVFGNPIERLPGQSKQDYRERRPPGDLLRPTKMMAAFEAATQKADLREFNNQFEVSGTQAA